MENYSTGTVKGVIANLLLVTTNGPVAQNEICYVSHQRKELMAEVIKVIGDTAYIQVFDSTRGIYAGSLVRFTGSLLDVTLGPGMLSRNYDGLQNDLDALEGLFLEKGDRSPALDADKKWEFSPLVKDGEHVKAGHWLGTVPEFNISHKIMVPLDMEGDYRVVEIATEGYYIARDIIAVLVNENGERYEISMIQRWPVKLPITRYEHKPRPSRILKTGVRSIDSLNPILEGGTGFIPGPFGCGKTVLQHAISKQAAADIVIVAACGERANEVVEILDEFPRIKDPRTGRLLNERTVIIANTSNMPVAAREASVYTAMTIAEYYRQMGLRVLLLADSTSRWAQALRETSNRLEDLPGPDAYPMDLSAIISNFYARAGSVKLFNGETGAITFIGTVSPAGGHLKEIVTESTNKATRCFYALSQQRADGKRYPAIDPVMSYSKYLEYPEFKNYSNENIGEDYLDNIEKMKTHLKLGDDARNQINILGDDGVPINYHIQFWRAELIDFVVLQQDAFDEVDAMTPMERQMELIRLVLEVCQHEFSFEDYDKVAAFYKTIINLFKQMNYAVYQSENYQKYLKDIQVILLEKGEQKNPANDGD